MPKRIITKQEKAEVCEMFIGLDLSIGEIQTATGINHCTISEIITAYLGTKEKPILFTIKAEE
jgi:hypothetical protein